MNKHTLFDYLAYAGTLIPDADALRDIASEDWWIYVQEHFDAMIWQHWYNRTVLMNRKFPYEPSDPDNTDNMDETVKNIIMSFTINLRTKSQQYKRLFETYMAEYNPLYNVDAWETEDRKLTQEGTDTNAHTGNDATVRAGNSVLEKTGSEINNRTGSEALSHSGSDTTINEKTTFNDNTFRDTDKSTVTPGVVDTTNYNNVKDTTSFSNRKDKTIYNDVTDTTNYDSSNINTKDLVDTEHIERRRFGNIGITKSSELVMDTQRQIKAYNFIFDVCHDCINTCTYMVE